MTLHRKFKNMTTKAIFAFLMLLTLGITCKAQNPVWINFTTSNSDLPDNTVSAIAIDNNGDAWIGTSGGLAKFDGTNFTLFNTDNSDLPHNSIMSVAVDSYNNKWIGTYQGLAKFDGINWTVYNTDNSDLPHNHISAIAIDNSGNPWIGTYESGLAKFDGNEWTIFNTENSALQSNNIYAIAIDNYGNKLIGTMFELLKYDNENWTSIYSDENPVHQWHVYETTVDMNDNIWFTFNSAGFFTGKLLKYNTSGEITFYNSTNSDLPGVELTSIQIDANNTKWIGTFDGGIATFDDSNWTVYNTENSGLINNKICSVAIDQQNNKWIGTLGGLSVFNEAGVQLSTEPYYSQQSNMVVYPNPAHDCAYIQNNSNSPVASIKLFDTKGQLIRSFPANSNVLHIAGIKQGAYMLHIQTQTEVCICKIFKISY